MTRDELKPILEAYAKWLNGEDGGIKANLRGADLRGANLRGADLRRANLQGANLRRADLDYSAWPLWCGSLDVKIDKRIFAQLAYHLCHAIVDDEECIAAQNALLHIANQFHRVDEYGLIKEKHLRE